MSTIIIQHKTASDMIASPDWAKYTNGPDWTSYKRKDASGHVCMKSEGIIPLTVIEVNIFLIQNKDSGIRKNVQF